jgi:cell division protein FtsQ
MRDLSDALIERGIAVRTRSFNGIELPGFRRKPRRGRALDISNSSMRHWRRLAIFVLLSGVGYGATIGGQTEQLLDNVQTGLGRLVVAAGFGVKRITVEGQRHATDAEITKALQTGPSTNMLAFDTDAAKARLEQVSWIKHAQVMRLLPSTLQVRIEECSPFAVWQTGGRTFVVDEEGAVLAPAAREAYPDLPLVVGEGAGKNSAALFETLTAYSALREQVAAALRVGDRRWTLKLTSGLEIMLPDDNIGQALDQLMALDRDHDLLHRNLATVDLRLGDRVAVRVRGNETGLSADTPPQEAPTAGTKATAPPARGST